MQSPATIGPNTNLSFDDSWMSETPGGDCNKIKEHRDDVDVTLREEERQKAELDIELQLAAAKSKLNPPQQTPPKKEETESIFEKDKVECSQQLQTNAASQLSIQQPASASIPVTTELREEELVFDDSWLDDVGDVSRCNKIGEYRDDDDVIAKSEEEAEALRVLALLQETD